MDKLQGALFNFFWNSDLLTGNRLPEQVQWLAHSCIEIVTQMFVFRQVTLGKYPGHGIYGDMVIRLPDEEKFWRNFLAIKKNMKNMRSHNASETCLGNWFNKLVDHASKNSLHESPTREVRFCSQSSHQPSSCMLWKTQHQAILINAHEVQSSECHYSSASCN